ncbi:MAG: hypothetical protein ACYDCK_08810 [Thermoplasmatota archaeon]
MRRVVRACSTPSRASLALVVALLVAAPLAGCIDNARAKLGLGGGGGSTPVARAPYKQTYHDFVAPSDSKTYDFPIDAGAVRARLDATLTCDAGQLPTCSPTSPAQIAIAFRDPGGSPVGESKTLNPSAPTGTLQITSFPSYGMYKLTVTGNGISGAGSGASYVMNLTVLYS